MRNNNAARGPDWADPDFVAVGREHDLSPDLWAEFLAFSTVAVPPAGQTKAEFAREIGARLARTKSRSLFQPAVREGAALAALRIVREAAVAYNHALYNFLNVTADAREKADRPRSDTSTPHHSGL